MWKATTALLCVCLCYAASGPTSLMAQVNGFGANAFNGGAFGNNLGGLGNAGGFATGGGLSNATTNSNYFGSTVVGSARTYGGFANGGYGTGAMVSVPGVNNYAGTAGSQTFGSAPGLSAFGTPLPFGVGTGMLPPNVTAEVFSGALPLASSANGAGYMDFGTAMNYSMLGAGGFGYPGLGYGGVGYPGMAYPGMPYPSMAADGSFATGSAGVDANGQSLPAPVNRTPAKPKLKSSGDMQDAQAATSNRRRAALVQDDGVPRSTMTAVRIQNRLNNLKSPNLASVKVLMNGRTATLSGKVDTEQDAQLAVRLVGLEPGVVKVNSELQW